jgi:hypothetical protein
MALFHQAEAKSALTSVGHFGCPISNPSPDARLSGRFRANRRAVVHRLQLSSKTAGPIREGSADGRAHENSAAVRNRNPQSSEQIHAGETLFLDWRHQAEVQWPGVMKRTLLRLCSGIGSPSLLHRQIVNRFMSPVICRTDLAAADLAKRIFLLFVRKT